MISRFFLVISILFISFCSCNFGDTNLDPTRETTADLKEVLPIAIAQSARNMGSIGGRVTGIVIQQFRGIDAQPESYSSYLIDERTLNRFWETGLYAGALKDCKVILNLAEEEDRPYYAGIAKVLMAFNLGIATSFWGEVPWKEALMGEDNLQPVYDSQESVYNDIQTLLDEAIILFNAYSENPPEEDDLIFQGDANKWITTAYALKARYYIQLSKRDENASSKALESIRNGVFNTLTDQPNFLFSNSLNEGNPLALFGIERPNQMVLGDAIKNILETHNDPRKEKLAIEINGQNLIFPTNTRELYWTRLETPIPFISLSELKFIEAEALLRLNKPKLAEQVFQNAVEVHFEQINMPLDSFTNVFLQNHINFNGLDFFEEKLERLITQKYIALFGQGFNEAWVDYRRTGYPKLLPPENANRSFNPSLIIPRRYLYPISERNTNLTNLNQAISRQNGQLMDVNLWVFE